MRFHPELINMKKDNGSSPLHVAAANNHYDVVSLLASHVRVLYKLHVVLCMLILHVCTLA